MNSFYWHDYETSGINPRTDRAMQFAGIRTDLDFNSIGEPLEVFCQPADDFLPHPEACMVTGITPQAARENGMPEAEFFAQINKELSEPGTCALGYNTIRFDDEFTRYGFYRNFFDPYAREWKNGNSRWDLIDLVRLTRALRPEGIEWPVNDAGNTSFRLEHLTEANGIAHQGAHDALVDVRATIEMAKLVRTAQPRLFDYVFKHRDKNWLLKQLDVSRRQPVVHVSGKYPSALGHIAVVVPLAMHPRNKNEVLVYDLRVDPTPLLTLPAEEIQRRIFTSAAELGEDESRIPIKSIRANRAPIVVPLNTVTAGAREQWQLDPGTEQRHLEVLAGVDFSTKLGEVFSEPGFEPIADPDQNLYGGFLSDHDRRLCDLVRLSSPGTLKTLVPDFTDPRLAELLFRYRARNWPETLNSAERNRWNEFRIQRLHDEQIGITLASYRKTLSRMAIDPGLTAEQRAVLNALIDWPEEIGLGG